MPVPDTVFVGGAMDGRGQLSLGVGILTADTVRGMRPSLRTFDLARCDDGWSFTAAGVACDRARFGHLDGDLIAGLRSDPPAPVDPFAGAGLRWGPSYRSTWSVTKSTR